MCRAAHRGPRRSCTASSSCRRRSKTRTSRRSSVAGTPYPLSPDETASRLRAQFGEDVVDAGEQHGHAVATVTVGRYHDVCQFLRDEPDFACDYCDFTGAVDWGTKGGFDV